MECPHMGPPRGSFSRASTKAHGEELQREDCQTPEPPSTAELRPDSWGTGQEQGLASQETLA